MRTASPALHRALRGSIDMQTFADIYVGTERGLERRLSNIALSEFNISWDDSREVQGTSSSAFVWADAHGGSIAPRDLASPLAPFSSWVAYRDVYYLDEPESIRQAFHRLSDSSDPESSTAFIDGEEITTSQVIRFDADDAMSITKREVFTVPTQAHDLSSVWAELARLTSWPATPTLPDQPIPAGFTYDESRLTTVYDLGKIIGGVPCMDSVGNISARPIAWPSATYDLTPVTTSVKSDVWPSDTVYNGVFVTTHGGDTPSILASATIDHGRLRWGLPSQGALGRIAYVTSEEWIDSAAKAQTHADQLLQQVSTMQAVGASVSIIPNPLLELGDVVQFPLDSKPTRGRIVKIKRSGVSMTLEVLCELR